MLYKGIEYGVGKECPNAAIYLASYGYIKPKLLAIPLVDPTNGAIVFGVLALAGALGDAAGSIVRVPLELLNKRLQTGISKTPKEALDAILESNLPAVLALSWAAVLARDMPFGALQLAFFEQFKQVLQPILEDNSVGVFVQRLVVGGAAGGVAALITTPLDTITTRVMIGGSDTGSSIPDKMQHH